MEESVDMIHMDTDAPSEHPVNDPIEIEEEGEEPPQGPSKGKSKRKQVARNYTQRAECWQHFIELKENGKRVADECKYCNKICKADSSKKG